MMPSAFRDRTHAGQQLAESLAAYADRRDVLVLGLPRGGVPVAYEVARRLNARLDLFVVRKLGVPGFEELAMGAVATGGTLVLDSETISAARLTESDVTTALAREEQELARRERVLRGSCPPPEITGRTIILVDDGLATGASMRAAVQALRQKQPASLIVAVPVSSPTARQTLEPLVDKLVALLTPAGFRAVGSWYEDFSDPSEEEIRSLVTDCNGSNHDRDVA